MLFAAFAYASPAPDIRDAIDIVDGEFVQTGALLPPGPETAWAPVSLPDSWRKQPRDRTRVGWYRFVFEMANAPDAPQAIYIPRITNNIALYVNGALLGVSGQLDKREMSWNLAQLFIAPPGMFKAGRNELLIRLHPDNMLRAGLSRVYLGGEAALRDRFDQRILLQATAPKFIGAWLGLTALLSFALWAFRRQETAFGFFTLLCLVMMARLWHTFAREIDSCAWLVAAPSLAWMLAMQTSFVLRFCGQAAPRFERVVAGFAVIATAVLLLSPTLKAVMAVFAVTALMGLAVLFVLGRALMRDPKLENITMLAAVVTNFALAIHDLLNYQELLEFDSLYLLPLGGPLLLLAVAILLLRRFIGAMQQHETLNTQLASRVQERERELTLSYERLRILDQQRATAEERQRLMRDMHDGIGSHLMSTLALSHRGVLTQHDMQEILADCIDELKITIDSLEPVESDLLVVLGNLRYRLEPRLNAAGIELEWAVDDLPPLAYLDPENTRSILRIVQEAFTNTLKHAHARRITLSTGVDHANARVWVRLTDDGVGFHPGPQTGRGVENMKNRAAKLNGQVEVVALDGGGTCVSLYLPLARMG